MELDRRIVLILVLAGAFITCLVVGDIIGGKLTEVSVGGTAFVISVGMIPFPVTFLLTDLINEFYGKKAARTITMIGFAMAVLTILLLRVALLVPFAPFTYAADWTGINQGAFDNVFGTSTRMFAASLVAYLTGQLVDIQVFSTIKRITGNRMIWLRATGSTAISQLIDTVVIQFIAWYGVMPMDRIVNIVGSSYVVKLLVAIGLTPLIYAGHALIARTLHVPPVAVTAQPRD